MSKSEAMYEKMREKELIKKFKQAEREYLKRKGK